VSGGGAKIVDKYSEKEKTHSEIETKKETENRGSAVPLHVKGYPLKLDLTEGSTVTRALMKWSVQFSVFE
jgi:hypothetical protein